MVVPNARDVEIVRGSFPRTRDSRAKHTTSRVCARGSTNAVNCRALSPVTPSLLTRRLDCSYSATMSHFPPPPGQGFAPPPRGGQFAPPPGQQPPPNPGFPPPPGQGFKPSPPGQQQQQQQQLNEGMANMNIGGQQPPPPGQTRPAML